MRNRIEVILDWIISALIVVALASISMAGFSIANAAEPFPESLKDSPQVLVCYFVKYNNGIEIRDQTDEWVITFGMATIWEPGEWILFVDKHGRRTKLPVPEYYTCTVL